MLSSQSKPLPALHAQPAMLSQREFFVLARAAAVMKICHFDLVTNKPGTEETLARCLLLMIPVKSRKKALFFLCDEKIFQQIKL